jgi:hypothetical protein
MSIYHFVNHAGVGGVWRTVPERPPGNRAPAVRWWADSWEDARQIWEHLQIERIEISQKAGAQRRWLR